MHKLLQIVLTTATLLLSTVAIAEGKIAVLSVQDAILNSDAAQKALNDLQDDESFKSNKAQFDKLTKEHDELLKKVQKDRAVMSDEQVQEEAKKIEEKRADIKHVGGKLQAARQQLAQQLIQQNVQTVQQIVNGIIQEEGIGLLLDSKAVMHADSSYNITAKVTDKLNQSGN